MGRTISIVLPEWFFWAWIAMAVISAILNIAELVLKHLIWKLK